MLFDHENAWKDLKIYEEIYINSIRHPTEFWKYHSNKLFAENVNNACFNCLDRHLIDSHNKPAIIWYGDEVSQKRVLSYKDLFVLTYQISQALLNKGVKKGDTVTIYAGARPEGLAAMLACARIGAVHNVVFAGFAPSVLRKRIIDSSSRIVLTTKEAKRGGKAIVTLDNVEKAITGLPGIEVLILEDIKTTTGAEIPYEEVSKEQALFMLYTSGSTGAPKPIIHKTFEYLLYSSLTFKFIFDLKDDDKYFCTSDIGWITGHSYMVYGPLSLGTTLVMFEGNPTYPDASRYWRIIENERVSLFYTAPTAIRSLSFFDKKFVTNHDLSSLRILGSVGEPLDPTAWKWYFEVVGQKRCPIVDTWWQTETGGIAIAPLLNLDLMKPGYASKPFFGVQAQINDEGILLIQGSCNFGFLNTGDRAEIDQDGDFKILGRADDVINVSGHRLGASEIEHTVNSLTEIEENAVVGIPHEIKGQSVFIFAVTSIFDRQDQIKLAAKIVQIVKKQIGSIAKPDDISFVKALPKTRSGKIKRALLQKIAMKTEISATDLEQVFNSEVIEDLREALNTAIHCPDVCSLQKRPQIR